MAAAIAALAVLFCLRPAPAIADYRLCNMTSYVLMGAIGYQADTGWRSHGWARLLPGACGTALPGSIGKAGYHVFARSIEAHRGTAKYFSGPERFCTVPGDFDIEGRESCALKGYDTNGFIRVETKPGSEWTTSFSEPRDYSPEAARIAGVQRLLRDNGFVIPHIDGIAGKSTIRAIGAFERASGKGAGSGTIDDRLVERLIEGAEREHEKTGLDLCNGTRHLVWAAIGYRTAEDEVSSGWVRIEPGKCAKAIKGALSARSYFVYAEAVGGKGGVMREGGRPLVWSGGETFCTKTTRFEISGRDDCARRGYDERNFMRIDTDGKPLRRVTLE